MNWNNKIMILHFSIKQMALVVGVIKYFHFLRIEMTKIAFKEKKWSAVQELLWVFSFNSVIKWIQCSWKSKIFKLTSRDSLVFSLWIFCFFRVGSRAIWYFRKYKILLNIKKLMVYVVQSGTHGCFHSF